MVSLPHSGPVSAPGLTGQPFSFLEMVFLSRGAVGPSPAPPSVLERCFFRHKLPALVR